MASLASTKALGNGTIDPDVRKRTEERLDEIELQNSVRILLAVESGSRAWGFPSPDSDYDVRFPYSRPCEWYLSINSRRDVIECPIEGMLDVKKALGLLLKANPVLSEWLCSPVRYKENQTCIERLRALGNRKHVQVRVLAYADPGGIVVKRCLQMDGRFAHSLVQFDNRRRTRTSCLVVGTSRLCHRCTTSCRVHAYRRPRVSFSLPRNFRMDSHAVFT